MARPHDTRRSATRFRAVVPGYDRRVDVVEIAPRLWRWTGFHEEWKEPVGSVYHETKDGVVLVDPLVPPEDPQRFLNALDREVVDQQVHVLVTVFWHTRSAAALVERYGHGWAPARGGLPSPAARARSRTCSDPATASPERSRPSRPHGRPRSCSGSPGTGRSCRETSSSGTARAGSACARSRGYPHGKGHPELAASLRPLLELDVERVRLPRGACARWRARCARGRPGRLGEACLGPTMRPRALALDPRRHPRPRRARRRLRLQPPRPPAQRGGDRLGEHRRPAPAPHRPDPEPRRGRARVRGARAWRLRGGDARVRRCSRPPRPERPRPRTRGSARRSAGSSRSPRPTPSSGPPRTSCACRRT